MQLPALHIGDLIAKIPIIQGGMGVGISLSGLASAVANEGGKAYIPFRKNATGRAGGSAIWKKMYHYFQLNRDEFMEHYHKRSNIEATNAAIKRKFGKTLKSKNPIAQVNELLAKIIAYNLTVVIHEMYENGINPGFLRQHVPQL